MATPIPEGFRIVLDQYPTFLKNDMTIKDKITQRKLSLLGLASEMSNVSKTCRIMGRKTFHGSIGVIQKNLDDYLIRYNSKRPRQGRNMKGKTPAEVFVRYIPKPVKPKKGGKLRKAA